MHVLIDGCLFETDKNTIDLQMTNIPYKLLIMPRLRNIGKIYDVLSNLFQSHRHINQWYEVSPDSEIIINMIWVRHMDEQGVKMRVEL